MKRSKLGYTLAELMLTVLILIVLFAVAVPGVLAIKEQFQMTALDETAREIYMAAQNNLVSRRAAGTIDSWGSKHADGEYWITSGDPDIGFVLPDGAVDIASGGRYLICYNKASGTVLETFYSENVSFGALSDSTIQNYSQSASKRKKDKIGFYSGSDVAGGSVFALNSPVLDFENGEELKLRVIIPRDDDLAGKTAKLTVKLEGDTADGEKATYTIDQSTFIWPIAPELTASEITLDSLTGSGFAELYPDIVPGTDVTVSASVSMNPTPIDGDMTTFLPGTVSGSVNSLFESRDGETVYISAGRHLQNLDYLFSGVDSSVTAAEQVENINWRDAYESLAFDPISNDSLISFNGNGNTITGLKIKPSGNAGLFAEMSGEIRGVRLEDPYFTDGTYGTYAGFLAGYVSDCEVRECRVYSKNTEGLKASAQYVGGLCGGAEKSVVSLCSASLKNITATGKTAGGLIGRAFNGSTIERAYASFGYLSNGAGLWTGGIDAQSVGGLCGISAGTSIQHCFTVGYVKKASHAAGLIGVGSTGSSIKNYAYSAMMYGDVPDSYGLADGNTVANQCFYWYTGTANISHRDESKEKSLKDFVGWTFYNANWTKRTSSTTFTYYCKSPYPYPVIQNLPYYGDWPIENVTDIIFHDRNLGTGTVQYILCPVGSSQSVYPTAMTGDKTAGEEVTFDGYSSFDLGISTEYDVSTGRTATVITGKRQGVYCITGEAGSCRARLVVIVYSAELTLTAKTPNGNKVTNTASTTNVITEEHPELQQERNLLDLDATGKKSQTATFETPTLTLHPSADEIKSAFASFRADNSSSLSIGKTAGSTLAETDWSKLNTVVNNTDLGSGVYVLKVDSTSPLKITGKSAGPASVTSTWAINTLLTVTCDIDVEGVQALIKDASAKASKSGETWSANDFPYMLATYPLAGEGVSVTFTPYLFDVIPSGKTQQYTWLVYDKSDNLVTSKTVNSLSPVTLDLTDVTNAFARYKVVLKFSYGSGSGAGFTAEYISADFMYVTISHRANDTGTTGLQPIQVNVGSDCSVEQIDWPSDSGHTDHCNEVDICGYVKGADDTQLLWYLMDENATDADPLAGNPTPLASLNDPVKVVRKNKNIATLTWSNAETQFNGVTSIGGTVTARADNLNNVKETTFKLVARARNNGDSDNAVIRVVTVHIMPKLQIIPSSIVRMGLYGDVSTTYRANRQKQSFEPSSYAFHWSKESGDDNNISFGSPSAYSTSVSTSNGKSGSVRRYTLKLTYGPYAETARLTAKSIVSNVQACINGDSDDEDNDYFLVELGSEKELMFSWGRTGLTSTNITAHPSGGSVATITKSGGSDNSSSIGFIYGERDYTVTGNAYGSATMSWTLSWWVVLSTKTQKVSYPIYVVGINSDKDAITLNGLETSDTFRLSSYFPKAIGTGNVKITSSSPGVVDVDVSSYSPGGTATVNQDIKVTAKKYGTTTLTAIYKIGDREYRDTCLVSVRPEDDTLAATLEPCTEDDRDTLVTLFGNVTNAFDELVTYAQYDTFRPTMFSEPVFGRKTIYLKSAVKTGDIVTTDYSLISDLRFYSSNANAATVEPSPYPVDGYWYLKVTANSGTINGDTANIGADYGTIRAPLMQVRVYSEPSVVIRKNNSSGEDVTNKHTKVPESTTFNDYVFHASIIPALYNGSMNIIDGLDDIHWYAEYPSEEFTPFLTLTGIDTNTVTVRMNAHHRCKVAITAQSALTHNAGNDDIATSAHALVFIPAE